MPLVDYGSSDESGSEESIDEKKTEGSTNEKNKVDSYEEDQKGASKYNPNNNLPTFNEALSESDPKLFATLPLPKSCISFGEDALKSLSKSKCQPVKILLPSLSEFQLEDNEEVSKKKKPSTKGSGLFALLPAPKNTNTLIPKSIQSKLSNVRKAIPVPKKRELLPVLKPSVSKTKLNDVDDDDDDPGENPTSFFFTADTDDSNVKSAVDEEIIPNDFKGMNSDISSILTATQNIQLVHPTVGNDHVSPSFSENNKPHLETMDVHYESGIGTLDDEAIEKLCGTRGRKRKGEVPEEIIDINVNSVVGNAYMRLSKDLTTEHEHRGFKKAKNLSVVERRKHQITYLASQAKEKEMELRNQWANSRMTRKQTQSKYGF